MNQETQDPIAEAEKLIIPMKALTLDFKDRNADKETLALMVSTIMGLEKLIAHARKLQEKNDNQVFMVKEAKDERDQAVKQWRIAQNALNFIKNMSKNQAADVATEALQEADKI